MCYTWWGTSCVHLSSSYILRSFIHPFPVLKPMASAGGLSHQQLLHAQFTFLFSFQIMANVPLGDKVLPLSGSESILAWFFRGPKALPQTKDPHAGRLRHYGWLSGRDSRVSSPFQLQLNEGTCFFPNRVWLWIHNTLLSSTKDLCLLMSFCRSSSNSNNARKLHLIFHFPLFVSSQI